ncbi:zinc-finger associated domain containing protein, partial [Oryctes borbonicus]
MSVEIIFEEEGNENNLPPDTAFDLADSCRTCLQPECSLTPTNSEDSDSIKFCDKLAACVSEMMWPKKGEPSFICGMCIEKLRIAYDFLIVCLESDQAVRLQTGANESQSSSSTIAALTTRCDKTARKVILNRKTTETQLKPLPHDDIDTSAVTQLEVKQTLDNLCEDSRRVCEKELYEHIDLQTVSIKSDIEIPDSKDATSHFTTTTTLSGCDETMRKITLSSESEKMQ